MENTTIDGRYLLLASLGTGGEARVFRARDLVTQREVAVRLLLKADDKSGTIRAPEFQHVRWVEFIAAGQDHEHGAYQVFELLEGRTLRQLVETGPLDRMAWRHFVDQSLEAVEAVHRAESVHGDLNADNFLHTASGWKLLELPFSRPEPPPGRSALFGSIHTMAPEQFSGATPDPLSDIYALGCLYYYAASCEYPHPGATAQEVAISCIRFAPVNLREKASRLPESWSEWVMKLLERNPPDRFPGIAAARHVLD